MPTLPSIEVSVAQRAKIMEAFPATENETSVEVYQKWLREQIRLKVLSDQRQRLEHDQRQEAYDREAALASLRHTLP